MEHILQLISFLTKTTLEAYILEEFYVLKFLFFFFLAMSCGMWESLVPWLGTELRPRQWNHRGLTTEPPGNSWKCHFNLTLHG